MAGYVGGPLIIDTIGGSSSVNFGGAVVVSPKTVTKAAYGAAYGNTAAFNISITGPSSTNTSSVDLSDQPVVGNN